MAVRALTAFLFLLAAAFFLHDPNPRITFGAVSFWMSLTIEKMCGSNQFYGTWHFTQPWRRVQVMSMLGISESSIESLRKFESALADNEMVTAAFGSSLVAQEALQKHLKEDIDQFAGGTPAYAARLRLDS